MSRKLMLVLLLTVVALVGVPGALAVSNLTSITVSPSTATLNVNGTQQFTATALNQNGTPVPGVNISWTVSNSTVGSISPSNATTDVNGSATTTFTALVPGTATVNATNGSVTGSADVTVTAPVLLGSISGRKFNDIDHDGDEEPADPGLANWTIVLTKPDGTTESTLTDTNGNYSFINLTAGNYTVSEVLEPGWMQSFPASGTYNVTLTAGQNVTGIDFGNFILQAFSISGFKINNETGSGISGWAISLENATTGAEIANTTTDTTGFYQFTNLTNGTYNVTEETRADFTPIGQTSKTVTIAGQNATNINFTNQPVPPPIANGSISGMKFNDSNGNRIKDENESGLADWQIDLNSSNGTTVATTTTGSGGTYTFSGIAPGNYTVQEILKSGWNQTAPANGTYNITLSAGQNLTGLDFGNQLVIITPTFSISGFKINNETDSGISGWIISLKNTTTGAEIANTTTNTAGFYQFTDLVNGSYNVTEETRAEFIPIGPTFKVITIAGQNVTNVNFTNQPVPPPIANGSISGMKFNDSNGNRIKDENESGLADWQIDLNSSNGTTVATTTTGSGGTYTFSGIAPGNYTVQEILKSGWRQTAPANGTYNITLSDGQNLTGLDFGNQLVIITPTFSISGFKINNKTGSGIPGWNITLTNDTIQVSTLTDANGFYQFTGLANGTYNVTEETRAGFTPIGQTSKTVTIAGQNVTNINFTNQPITVTFSISGFKINGATGTGIQGWIIMLKNATTGAPIFNTTTDATGFYQFTNLANGTYNVTEEIRTGFTPTSATFQVITIAGRSVTNVNFTNTPVRPRLGSISGFKIDIASGRGLPNWTIKLIGIVGKGTETRVIRMETTTNADGFYKFDNLPAGRYILREELQGGFVPVGSPVKNIMLAQGENSMNNNFTNRPIRSLVNTDDIRDIANRALDNTDKDDIGDMANRALDNMDTDGLSRE